jgi:hypothetical protein
MFTKEGVCRLYEFEGRYFVCSVAGIAETDALTELPTDTDDVELGRTIVSHLMEYRIQDSRDGRLARVGDWAAFARSGAKSAKSFESRLWDVDVRLKNGNVTIEARPRLSLKDHISVCATARVHMPDNVGSSARQCLDGAKALRERGLI